MTSDKHMEENESHTTDAEKVEKVKIGDEMEQSYIDYAMSVIVGRALPDARDGLKPVQRRILYSMWKEKISSNTSHRKSSSIVGETMGNFHPHGDSAIYDALARMAQDFSLRAPLVDGQGNYGSMDGDSPAAMRYTEARLSEYGELLLKDLNDHTVSWEPNYDGRMDEPEVLPAAFPNLLVNGSSGIAVGMSTEIPPHNINEVIDATIHLIENPECDIDDLLEHVNGPDFPTGGELVYDDGVNQAYKTGKGTMKVRASYEVQEDKNRIVITELPYQKRKKKSSIVKKIAEMVKDGELEGVTDLRDESNREGIKIVIDLKKDVIPEVVENILINRKVLQNNLSMINLALVDGQPTIMNLKQTLQEYISHRKNIIQNRTQRNLEEAQDRSHLLEGKLTALENVEDVVEIIRGEENRSDAVEKLHQSLELTQKQAKSIVRMQLGSLTSMEKHDVKEEYNKLEEDIKGYKKILSSEAELLKVVKEELLEVKEDYGSERKTDIVFDEVNVEYEDLIPEEPMVVSISERGYIKRTHKDEYRKQNRRGKGIIGMKTKNGDSIANTFTCSTHQKILFFTDKGDVYSTKCYNLPQSGRNSKGSPIHSIIGMDKDESVEAVYYSDFEEGEELVISTQKGLVKKTPAEQYENIYANGIRAIQLNKDDSIADLTTCKPGDDLILTTRNGYSIRFNEGEVRSVGRSSKGVKGIALSDDDSLVSIDRITEDDYYILTVTENGYGKKTPLSKFGSQSRGGKGYINIKTGDRNGKVIDSVVKEEEPSDIILASSNNNMIRFDSGQISSSGRNTKGVLLMDAPEVVSINLS